MCICVYVLILFHMIYGIFTVDFSLLISRFVTHFSISFIWRFSRHRGNRLSGRTLRHILCQIAQ